MRTILLVAFEGVQILDLTGPSAVFAEAAEAVHASPYDIRVVSASGGVVSTTGCLGISSARFDEFRTGPIDTLLLPGGEEEALRRLIADKAARDWVVEAASRSRRVASVCTGAFALASWGLLDGRRVTTHWKAAKDLAERFPQVHAEPAALFIQDGPIWTSAGVSTGLDMALAMVEEDLGRTAATETARRLVLQMRRPGHQSQYSSVLEAQGGAYSTLTQWIIDNLHQTLTIDVLAERAAQSTRAFHRRFTMENGITPAAFVQRQRLDRARVLLEAGQSPKRVASSVGLGSLDRLGRAFRRAYGLSPSEYRILHGRTSNR